jgi:hypothetical protein
MNLRISIFTMIIGGIAAGNVLADVTASSSLASRNGCLVGLWGESP